MSKTALLFAGQGAQTVGMTADLAEQFPDTFQRLAEVNEWVGFDLTSLCFHGPEEVLTRTENAQPAIFFAGWFAFEILREKVPGLRFDATAGLSLGEITALAAAGAVSYQDGVRLVHQRGRLMQEACEETEGTMAAVIGLDRETTEEICRQTDVELANLNCPGQLVISGEIEKVNQACEQAKAKGAKRAIPLSVAGAYHSRLMKGAADRFQQTVEATPFSTPQVPVLSNVTALPHESKEGIPHQLVRQITSPVRWEEGMRYLLDQGFRRFVELGPGTTLSGFMKRIDKQVETLNVGDVDSLERTRSALTQD